MEHSVYPKVLSEEETLQLVLDGRSIARYGDGELKLMFGKPCVSQLANTMLAAELRNIIAYETKALIGIPTLDKRNPKYGNWLKLVPKFESVTEYTKPYGSSFITRPDNAPWINTPKFFDQLESLWRGKRVTFVGNGVRSLTAAFLEERGAKVDWVVSAYRDAYRDISRLEHECMGFTNNRVILCVGPTATCLAERLAQRGMHAIDLGHIGMFWRRYNEDFVEQREINKDTNIVEPNP